MITYKKLYQPDNIKENEIILDIETTGLDSSCDQLVVLGTIAYEDDKCYIKQYFAEDDHEEKRLLEIYTNLIVDKTIINFNGDIFDIPFLNNRLIANELFPVFPDSYDILKEISSKRKFFVFESMKLIDLEKKIGIFRDDPSRYKVISKLTDDIIKRDKPKPIMIHNENDLIATEKLANIKDYFNDELSTNLANNKITLNSSWINNDIAKFVLTSEKSFANSYFNGPNYELRIEDDKIDINLQVLYGMFDENTRGFVALNTFNLENFSTVDVDPKLYIIKENYIFNYKNILNLSKKIIETHL